MTSLQVIYRSYQIFHRTNCQALEIKSLVGQLEGKINMVFAFIFNSLVLFNIYQCTMFRQV